MYFIDTNIFVYAFDETDLLKTQKARKLLTKLSASKEGCISTQVIQEFCNVVLRKSITPLDTKDVRKIISELLAPMLLHQPNTNFFLRTLETYERYSLSFYDAAIVQAAIDCNCELLYSEDLQAETKYGNTLVINPFN